MPTFSPGLPPTSLSQSSLLASLFQLASKVLLFWRLQSPTSYIATLFLYCYLHGISYLYILLNSQFPAQIFLWSFSPIHPALFWLGSPTSVSYPAWPKWNVWSAQAPPALFLLILKWAPLNVLTIFLQGTSHKVDQVRSMGTLCGSSLSINLL